MDWATLWEIVKGWPAAVVLILFILFRAGWWARANIPTKAELDAKADQLALDQLRNDSLARYSELGHVIQKMAEDLNDSMRKNFLETREVLRLYDLKISETVGDVHNRMDKHLEKHQRVD